MRSGSCEIGLSSPIDTPPRRGGYLPRVLTQKFGQTEAVTACGWTDGSLCNLIIHGVSRATTTRAREIVTKCCCRRIETSGSASSWSARTRCLRISLVNEGSDCEKRHANSGGRASITRLGFACCRADFSSKKPTPIPRHDESPNAEVVRLNTSGEKNGRAY